MPFNKNHRALLLQFRRQGISLSAYQKAVDGTHRGQSRKLGRAFRQLGIAFVKSPFGSWLKEKIEYHFMQ